MKIIKTIKQMQSIAGRLKTQGKTIGFVPTMGALHEGHLSLVRQAKSDCDICVMSIFVNPSQFGPGEDFKKYPRNLKLDSKLAKSVNVDYIFYPAAAELYPRGYSTYITLDALSDALCGKSRPGHFRGVATVVAKLFNIVRPDIAYFGQKDAQQSIIIKRMVCDLNMQVRIKIMPIIREPDGLAMSSRNVYLSESERSDARILFKALQLAENLIKSANKNSDRIIKEMFVLINKVPAAKIDYVSIVNAFDLSPVKDIKGEVLIAIAVYIGKTRLIDNIIVKT